MAAAMGMVGGASSMANMNDPKAHKWVGGQGQAQGAFGQQGPQDLLSMLQAMPQQQQPAQNYQVPVAQPQQPQNYFNGSSPSFFG